MSNVMTMHATLRLSQLVPWLVLNLVAFNAPRKYAVSKFGGTVTDLWRGLFHVYVQKKAMGMVEMQDILEGQRNTVRIKKHWIDKLIQISIFFQES